MKIKRYQAKKKRNRKIRRTTNMYPLHSIKMRELQLKFQSDAHTVKKNKLKKSVTQFL